MNLYIISEVLSDYTSGMAVIAAPDLDRCRAVFAQEFGHWDSQMREFDSAISDGSYKVLQVQGQEEGMVSYVSGGG